ncbi:MAG TPA: hypothetical protein PKN60_07445, partial [Bacteroidales bacterium]|nr:hypothetical protein [Bacteroidales bacterium]
INRLKASAPSTTASIHEVQTYGINRLKEPEVIVITGLLPQLLADERQQNMPTSHPQIPKNIWWHSLRVSRRCQHPA